VQTWIVGAAVIVPAFAVVTGLRRGG